MEIYNDDMEHLQKIIENAVFTDSVIEELRRKQGVDINNEVNRLLMDKAQELGVSLYEVCANYVPEIRSEIVEVDWYKEKREWPDLGISTLVKLIRRD